MKNTNLNTINLRRLNVTNNTLCNIRNISSGLPCLDVCIKGNR